MVSVRDKVTVKKYPEERVPLAGRMQEVSALSEGDVKIFTRELERVVDEDKSPTINRMVTEHADQILDVVRLVNKDTGQGFGGALGTGNELTINLVTASDLEREGSQLTKWERSLSSTGTTSWLYSASAGSVASTSEEQALVILGVSDPVQTPKIDQLQFVKNDNKQPVENLSGLYNRKDFGENETPVHEFKESWIIPPEQEFYARAHVHTTGSDKLQPIGFAVKRARDTKTLGGDRITS